MNQVFAIDDVETRKPYGVKSKILIYLAVGSVILNIYFHAIWIYSYNTTKSHTDAVLRFNAFFPTLSTATLYGIMLILTISSILIFARLKTNGNFYLYNSFITIQGLLLILFVWSLL
jgi:hypothetical protein